MSIATTFPEHSVNKDRFLFMGKQVLITGGTGLIGSHLTRLLLTNQYSVSHLSRTPKENGAVKTYTWDIEKQEMDEEALATADYVIHLAGANVGDHRWTKTYKQEILQSRTASARLLYKTIKGLKKHKIKALASASGISIYGDDTGSTEIIESSPHGNEFMAEVCEKWEAGADNMKELGMRVVKLRTGMVLSTKGGALGKMITPFKLGAGAPLGSGQQYVSWIHIDDLCRMYEASVEHETYEGVYNAVAPRPVTNEEFSKTIAKVLDKPFFLPNVPSVALRLVFGELAGVVLGGNKVSSQKIEATGFTFLYRDVEAALRNLLEKAHT